MVSVLRSSGFWKQSFIKMNKVWRIPSHVLLLLCFDHSVIRPNTLKQQRFRGKVVVPYTFSSSMSVTFLLRECMQRMSGNLVWNRMLMAQEQKWKRKNDNFETTSHATKRERKKMYTSPVREWEGGGGVALDRSLKMQQNKSCGSIFFKTSSLEVFSVKVVLRVCVCVCPPTSLNFWTTAVRNKNIYIQGYSS